MTNTQIVHDDDGAVYTPDEALILIGFGKFQILILVYAGLGSISEATEVMILSFIGPSVKSEWNLSSTQEGLITTVVFAGTLIGAYAWGLISDTFGRRVGLLSIAMLTSTAGFLSAFSPNYILFIILRFLVGIGLGGGTVYSTWFMEFVPAPNRGMWMVIFSTFWTIGSVGEAALGWIIMPSLGWRWLLALSCVPSFVALVLCGLTPESPRYLSINGQMTEALKILQQVATVNRKELPSGALIFGYKNEEDEECAPLIDNDLLLPTEKKTLVSKTGFSNISMLFSSTLRRTSLLLWVIFFGNSFLFYGIVLLTSELSGDQSTCSSSLLHSSNSTKQDSSLYTVVFVTSLAELPGIVLSAVIIDRVGRKLSMISMFSFGCIFLVPLVLHQNEIITTGLLFGARMFIIGTFAVANIYAPEIYPTSVRTTACGVASSVGCMGAMISPVLVVQLVSDCHQTALLLLLVLVFLLSALSVLLLPFETKGQQLTDTLPIPILT